MVEIAVLEFVERRSLLDCKKGPYESVLARPMRTAKTISISLLPRQLESAERIAKKENRTMSELVGEALRRYEKSARTAAPGTLAEAVSLLREDARAKGTDKLTMREINAEVAAVRRGRRKKSHSPVA